MLVFIILIMWACVSMCTCVQGPQSPEEGSSPTGAGLRGSCEAVCGCWEPGSLEELLTFQSYPGGLAVSPTGRRDCCVCFPSPVSVRGCSYLGQMKAL